MILAFLELRARVCMIYQRFQLILDPIIKFFAVFIAIRALNNEIGFETRLMSDMVVVILALLSAFTPMVVFMTICILLSIVHTFSASMVLGALLFIIYCILYCFFLRFAPKYIYLTVVMPLLFVFKIPYIVPLLLGLYTSPVTILPMSCGIFLYYFFDVIKESAAAVTSTTFSPDDALLILFDVVEKLKERPQIVYMVMVFAVVQIVVYVIRKIRFAYSFETSLAVGVFVSLVSCIAFKQKLTVLPDIGMLVAYTLISGIIALVILFFKRVLDYSAVEQVQFEDDDYYYYVKAVPKLKVSMPQISITKINENRRNRYQDYEDEEDDLWDSPSLRSETRDKQRHSVKNKKSFFEEIKKNFRKENGRTEKKS